MTSVKRAPRYKPDGGGKTRDMGQQQYRQSYVGDEASGEVAWSCAPKVKV